MKFLLIFFILNSCFLLIASQSNLTLDSFFNYTVIKSISLSSDAHYLIVQTQYPQWDLNTFEDNLWLCTISERECKEITNQYFSGVKYQWSSDGKSFVFLMKSNSTSDANMNLSYLSKLKTNFESNLYFYSTETEKITSIPIENELPTALTWTENSSSIFYSTFNINSSISTIHQIEISHDKITTKDIVQVPFLITELLYSSKANQLIFVSASLTMEHFNNSQIYSHDLRSPSSIKQLTNDFSSKQNLQLANNQTSVYFLRSALSLAGLTQQRLYLLNLITGESERCFDDFQGNIQDYTIDSMGYIYYLGQLGVQIQMYAQRYSSKTSTRLAGNVGSYVTISTSSTDAVAFVFTSYYQAQKVYFMQDIRHLNSPVEIGKFNEQYSQIHLPRAESYQWKNPDDNQTVEGILYYPPNAYQQKNLPLLVLIHGGPTGADTFGFIGHWYYWAPLAATYGWLVFQPNYRGSTGYGDEFVNKIRYEILTNPSKDILYGIDQLVADQHADPNRISIGGYSYGGVLTNWLITQTIRFKAALSGAGSVEHVSFWGMQDTPAYLQALLGGFPWERPALYLNQSAIYYFDRIRTPTHIVAGTADVRVPFSQSLMLERSLRQLGIPVQLLLLPNEQHGIANNPWHGKVKVREELEWLKLYG